MILCCCHAKEHFDGHNKPNGIFRGRTYYDEFGFHKDKDISFHPHSDVLFVSLGDIKQE